MRSSVQTRVKWLSRSSRQERGASATRSSEDALSPSSVSKRPPTPPPSPTGLTVLYTPETVSPSADIIFVHGLRGNSMNTWSYDKEPDSFWPKKWLPNEPVLRTARISTFGYNSDWLSIGSSNIVNITDFASLLLSSLHFAINDTSEEHPIGKAYIFGKDDLNYQGIVQSTCAIIFMSTPHRGSELAEILKMLSKKEYVNELVPNSRTLEDDSLQFEKVSSGIDIISFYETVPSSVWPLKRMVTKKDSSILGLRNEIRIPMDTNHREICKFRSEKDDKYLSVRNVLRNLVTKFGVTKFGGNHLRKRNSSVLKSLRRIQAMLGTTGSPNEDRAFYKSARDESSCQWILKDPRFDQWLKNSNNQPHILWIHGPQGSGKSVLSSFLIDHLSNLPTSNCQYFYFRFNDQAKVSLEAMLRSIAYQAACQFPDFRQILDLLAEDGTILHTKVLPYLWEVLIEKGLATIKYSNPVYWVIDSLDESSSPFELLPYLASLEKMPFRIVILSRELELLKSSFNKLKPPITLDLVPMDPRCGDLSEYVKKNVRVRGNDPELRNAVIKDILERARGNFLWAREAIREVARCHIPEEISKSLKSLPPDLENLYKWTAIRLSSSWQSGDGELAKRVLGLVACSQRPLTIEEVKDVLYSAEVSPLDLKTSIRQVCGDFIEIDHEFRVLLAHDSVRNFLSQGSSHELSLNLEAIHYDIFVKCMSILTKLGQNEHFDEDISESFVIYAATFWHRHLEQSNVGLNDRTLLLLDEFFCDSPVMVWISFICSLGNLETLIETSASLANWLTNVEKINDSFFSKEAKIKYKVDILQQWAKDLFKIVSMFGDQLINHPDVIYDIVPAFCPSNTAIREYGSKNSGSPLMVTGLSYSNWDNSEACFALNRDDEIHHITSSGKYFAIATTSKHGHVEVFQSTTNQKIHDFDYGEPIITVKLSHSGNRLIIYGSSSTKIWDMLSCSFIFHIPNPTYSSVLDINFSADDKLVFIFLDDGIVRRSSLDNPADGWQDVCNTLSQNHAIFGGVTCACFSIDSTLVAVSYKGGHLVVWKISQQWPITSYDARRPGGTSNKFKMLEITQVTWNPGTKHIMGKYSDGRVFKWRLSYGKPEVLDVVAYHVQCSSDGTFFATWSPGNVLKFWDIHNFNLIQVIHVESDIKNIRISRDGKKVYIAQDAAFCTIWQLTFPTVSNSHSSQISRSAILESFNNETPYVLQCLDTITALAVCPGTSSYCIGDASGQSKIVTKDGKEIVSFGRYGLPVKFIAWSDDGRYVAVADGTTTVYIIDLWQDSDVKPKIKIQHVVKSQVRQLLFSRAGNLVLAVVPGRLILIPMDESSKILTYDVPESYFWINHPREEVLLGISCSGLFLIPWDKFPDGSLVPLVQASSGFESQTNQRAGASNSVAAVTNILMTPDSSTLLITITQPSRMERIECRAWLDSSSSKLTKVTEDGLVFCPRQNEVAIVRNGFKSAWVE
ncbi:hypothetical protein B7463_g884, partial [Scytalidium lignicola]